MSDSERRDFVREYIKRAFRNTEFKLENGRAVLVTGTGAKKISSTFLPKQRVGLELDRLFEVARFDAVDENPQHDKFVKFEYYDARVKIGGTMFSCVLNVGIAKDSNYYQLYDVNQFNIIK